MFTTNMPIGRTEWLKFLKVLVSCVIKQIDRLNPQLNLDTNSCRQQENTHTAFLYQYDKWQRLRRTKAASIINLWYQHVLESKTVTHFPHPSRPCFRLCQPNDACAPTFVELWGCFVFVRCGAPLQSVCLSFVSLRPRWRCTTLCHVSSEEGHTRLPWLLVCAHITDMHHWTQQQQLETANWAQRDSLSNANEACRCWLGNGKARSTNQKLLLILQGQQFSSYAQATPHTVQFHISQLFKTVSPPVNINVF